MDVEEITNEISRIAGLSEHHEDGAISDLLYLVNTAIECGDAPGLLEKIRSLPG